MSAFLKRKAKPKCLSFQLSSTGEVAEEKIGDTAWYDMLEDSVLDKDQAKKYFIV